MGKLSKEINIGFLIPLIFGFLIGNTIKLHKMEKQISTCIENQRTPDEE